MEGRSYTLWTPGGSSRQNLKNRVKDKARQTGRLHLVIVANTVSADILKPKDLFLSIYRVIMVGVFFHQQSISIQFLLNDKIISIKSQGF